MYLQQGQPARHREVEEKLIKQNQQASVNELKWVCSAKGDGHLSLPLSHKEIMQPQTMCVCVCV